ncbi:MAG: DNA topoisomerase, partial [Myxococcales bacterium]|nr:DNA topoisomerase [Myxococcales bacterium]
LEHFLDFRYQVVVKRLEHFLDFRYQVVVKRLEHELRELMARIHILEGFEKVFDHLDEAIAIIRASDDKKDAGERLIARFDLSEIQAEAILETRLHKLARMEILAIREELAEKRAEAARIQALLDSPRKLWALIKRELTAIADAYQDARRTTIGEPVPEVTFDPEAYIVDEPCTLIVTRD